MFDGWSGLAVGAAAGSVLPMLGLGLWWARWEPVEPATALVIEGARGRRVALRSCLVWPTARVRRLCLRPVHFEIALQGDQAVWTRDRARVEVVAHVSVRMAREPDRILEILDGLGCESAVDPKVLRDLFAPHLEEALHAVASTFSGEEVYTRRLDFRDRVLELVGPHLRGYRVDELAISTFQKISG